MQASICHAMPSASAIPFLSFFQSLLQSLTHSLTRWYCVLCRAMEWVTENHPGLKTTLVTMMVTTRTKYEP
jgi:hypothetical protein